MRSNTLDKQTYLLTRQLVSCNYEFELIPNSRIYAAMAVLVYENPNPALLLCEILPTFALHIHVWCHAFIDWRRGEKGIRCKS